MMEKIVKIVADHYGVDYYALFKKTRKRTIVRTRQMSILLSRMILKMSYSELGGFFFLDHSTAIHSEKTAKNDINTDKNIERDYVLIKNKLSTAGISVIKTKVKKSKFCNRMKYDKIS